MNETSSCVFECGRLGSSLSERRLDSREWLLWAYEGRILVAPLVVFGSPKSSVEILLSPSGKLGGFELVFPLLLFNVARLPCRLFNLDWLILLSWGRRAGVCDSHPAASRSVAPQQAHFPPALFQKLRWKCVSWERANFPDKPAKENKPNFLLRPVKIRRKSLETERQRER